MPIDLLQLRRAREAGQTLSTQMIHRRPPRSCCRRLPINLPRVLRLGTICPGIGHENWTVPLPRAMNEAASHVTHPRSRDFTPTRIRNRFSEEARRDEFN
ncbi:hypothetical protein J6590_000954 [Homalodisca vitripennis]|nr:hypothetical protein J6590_000954 [Homalodisca vitripennis]